MEPLYPEQGVPVWVWDCGWVQGGVSLWAVQGSYTVLPPQSPAAQQRTGGRRRIMKVFLCFAFEKRELQRGHLSPDKESGELFAKCTEKH